MSPARITLTRRQWLARSAIGAASTLVLPFAESCSIAVDPEYLVDVDGKLHYRPSGAPTTTAKPGLKSLGVGHPDAQLYVPAGYDGVKAVPLLVLLHGAGGDSKDWADDEGVISFLDELGIAMLAPSSRGWTWRSKTGDASFIDKALAATFSMVRVDTSKVAMGGFSDGASFGMLLGLANGDLFSHVFVFSGGYLTSFEPVGKPLVYMTHGTGDGVIPYSNALAIADTLRQSGYTVQFVSFEGGHTLPLSTAHDALRWFRG